MYIMLMVTNKIFSMLQILMVKNTNYQNLNFKNIGIRPVGYYIARAQATQGVSSGFTGANSDSLPELCQRLNPDEFDSKLEVVLKDDDAFKAVLESMFDLVCAFFLLTILAN
jgi:hypothetical protein